MKQLKLLSEHFLQEEPAAPGSLQANTFTLMKKCFIHEAVVATLTDTLTHVCQTQGQMWPDTAFMLPMSASKVY